MSLVIFPDDRLRQKSAPVESIDSTVRSTLNEMRAMMIQSDGVGLAAPQIGVMSRMFVADLDGSTPMFFINPTVRDLHGGTASSKEGCLSVPGAWGEIKRPASILIKFLDFSGKPGELVCSGLLAAVVQHETDHLDGILHIDRMEPYVKRIALDSAWTRRLTTTTQSR